MKKLLLGLLVLVSISVNAQTKRDKFIDRYAGGNVKLTYQRSIDLDKGDTLYMVFFIYQNAKYSTITDTKVIGLYNKEELAQFVKDMKTAYKITIPKYKEDLLNDKIHQYNMLRNRLYVTRVADDIESISSAMRDLEKSIRYSK